MSLSNTATTAYQLVKYSRSVPQPSGAVGSEEWQHFVNPILRLTLDVKKSASGELESFRVRVLWSLDSQMDPMNGEQRDVVFEDIEMLSFSSLPSYPSHAQGLPLKAVYRDSVVGVRYLHPRVTPPGTTPVYRRFQITFQTAASASGFIDLIRFVCPCKLNGAPAAPARSATRAPTMAPAGCAPSSVPATTQVEAFSQVNANTPSRRVDSPLASSATISAAWNQTIRDDPLGQPFSHPQASSSKYVPQAPHTTPLEQFVGIQSLGPPSEPLTDMRPSSRPSSAITDYSGMPIDPAPEPRKLALERLGAAYPSSLPRSSPTSFFTLDTPPSSAVHSARTMAPPAMPAFASAPAPAPALAPASVSAFAPASVFVPNSVPVPAAHAPVSLSSPAPQPGHTTKQVLLASLEAAPTLYSLPRKELETLVAKVIREEGFAKLLEDLDSLWRIKGLVGHPSV